MVVVVVSLLILLELYLLKMYIKNIDATVKFHAKFAESNNLLLANSIANKIEDTQIRENTLSEISKSIIMRKENVRE